MVGLSSPIANSSEARRRKAMLAWEMRMFAAVENCWRMDAADRAEEAYSYDRSRSMTMTPTPRSSRVSQ